MARPRNCRRVGCLPGSQYFKPRGIPLSGLEEIKLTVDEFEALRLADLEGLYQDQAAGRMNVSRQTFGRIIGSGHKKVAEALVKGKALKIEGGDFDMASIENLDVMIANILGICLTERVDQRTALPAKAATFTEQRKAEDTIEDLGKGKAGVVV